MQAKVCLVGPKGVGKSSLTSRIESTKSAEQLTVSGIRYTNCNVLIGEKSVDLQILDLSGEDGLRCMGPIFYKQAKAALCIFDLTSKKSFESLGKWIKEVKNNASDECVLIVVGNKIDLFDRNVGVREAKRYATSVGAKYFEVSAHSGKGILNVLVYMSKQLLRLNDCYVSYIAKMSITSNSMEWCLPKTMTKKRRFSFPSFSRLHD